MDAGYNFEPILTQVYSIRQQSGIAYNKRNEPEPLEFEKTPLLVSKKNDYAVMMARMLSTKQQILSL